MGSGGGGGLGTSCRDVSRTFIHCKREAKQPRKGKRQTAVITRHSLRAGGGRSEEEEEKEEDDEETRARRRGREGEQEQKRI